MPARGGQFLQAGWPIHDFVKIHTDRITNCCQVKAVREDMKVDLVVVVILH